MTVYLVGAGPGDPGLLTRRGAELWDKPRSSCSTGWWTRVCSSSPRADAVRLDVGKRPGQLRHQDEINALLLEHARLGKTVVRLKGGDPFVFGRGGEEAEVLLAPGSPSRWSPASPPPSPSPPPRACP